MDKLVLIIIILYSPQPSMADFTASLITLFTFSSSKRTFSQPFIEKCITEVVRNGSTLIFHLSKAMKSQILHTIWCTIFGAAAGEIWSWSVLGMKGLIDCFYLPCPAPWKNLDRCSLFYSHACARTSCYFLIAAALRHNNWVPEVN